MPPVDILPSGSPATPRASSTTAKHAAAPLGAVVAVWRWARGGFFVSVRRDCAALLFNPAPHAARHMPTGFAARAGRNF